MRRADRHQLEKGRGAVTNPAGRFEATTLTPEDDGWGSLDAVDERAAVVDPQDHLAPVGARHVAGREGRQRPADRLPGRPQVQQVLLGLVGVVPDGLGERVRPGVVGNPLHPHQPLQRVEAPPGAPPVALLRPGQGAVHALGGAPAVGVAEAGEQAAGGGVAVAGDELGAQEPQRHGVQQEGALPIPIDIGGRAGGR